MVNDLCLLLCGYCQALMFASIECDQLLGAAKDGRADDVIALLAEGANIECKDRVRSLCF